MEGTITAIDCRHIARGAKLAGAPREPAAGIDLRVRVGERVSVGQPLFVLHAQAAGELAYAADYLARHPAIVIAPGLSERSLLSVSSDFRPSSARGSTAAMS